MVWDRSSDTMTITGRSVSCIRGGIRSAANILAEFPRGVGAHTHGSILPAAARIRTIGLVGFRRATSLNPAASYIDFAPNHMESSFDRLGLSTGYASRRATPRFLAYAIAPSRSARATPWPRYCDGTTKQMIDQTGSSSTAFITGERQIGRASCRERG